MNCDCSGKPLPPKSRKPITRAQKAMIAKGKEKQIAKIYEGLRRDGVKV